MRFASVYRSASGLLHSVSCSQKGRNGGRIAVTPLDVFRDEGRGEPHSIVAYCCWNRMPKRDVTVRWAYDAE